MLILCAAGVVFGCGMGIVAWISARRLREVRKKAMLYRTVLDNLPGYIFAKDAKNECRYVFLNEVYGKLVEDDTESRLGSNDQEWVRDQHLNFWEQDQELLRSGKKESCEVETVMDGTGKAVYGKVYKKVVDDQAGSRLIIGMGVDVTRERELEDELTRNIQVLDEHVRNERTINRCLAAISGGDDISKTLPFVLREMGIKSKADRCSIFSFSEDIGTFRLLEYWVQNEFADPLEDFGDQHIDDFGNLRELLLRDRPLVIDDTRCPLDGQEMLCQKLQQYLVRSTMVLGIKENGRLLGFAAIDYFDSSRHFTETDLEILQSLCTCFQLAMERDRRIKEIAKGATMLQQVFESITVPVMLFDLDFNVVAANTATSVSTGVPMEELIGRKCHDALCNHNCPPEWCPMRRTMADGKMAKIDFEGHGKQYIVSTHAVHDQNGKMVYVLETAFDITEQKEQEKQLQTMNLMLNNASEIARISYFTGDHDTNVTIIGGAADIGLPTDGEKQSLLNWVVPEDREELERQRLKVMADGSYMCNMICRSNATGELRSYRLIVQRSRLDERISVGLLQDITDYVALENERQKLIRSLHNYVEGEKAFNACLSQIAMEDDFGRNVDEILQVIAVQFDCDRVFFGDYEEPDKAFHLKFEKTREGVIPRLGATDLALEKRFRQWYSKFMNNESVSISAENDEYAEMLKQYSCQALLCTPVWVNNKLYGVLGASVLYEKQGISRLDENIMRSAAKLLVLARERQIQRDALMALDRQNALIFDVMPVAVCFYNAHRDLIRCNQAAATLFGHTMEEMLSKPCYETMCLVPGGLEDCPIQAVIDQKIIQTREIVVGTRECQLLAIPIFDKEGKLTNIIESLFDVTELKEGKRRLEEALTAAEVASRAKSFFFATMSHELRTPLNAVIGFSELLQNSELAREEQEEYLKSINLAGNSLLYLINDILDLSKLEADQMVLVPQETDVGALLKELKSVFNYKVRTQNLYFDLILPEDLPLLKLDSLRLRQVLLNLIGNAVKFTPEGGIIVRVNFQPTGNSNGTLTLSVKDTGIGIRKEAQEKIFEPFIQQDALRDSHAYKGSGLGLAITKRLINCMNGTISLESDIGKGCDFVVELRDISYIGALPVPVEKTTAPHELETDCCRVLLVDDIQLNLKVLRAMLRKLGVECLTANSGPEALTLLRNDRAFNALLTDMWMPEMNGAELAAAIHHEFSDAVFPIVAVTADTEAGDNFPKEHFAGILLKPVTVEKLQKLFSNLKNKENGWNVI